MVDRFGVRRNYLRRPGFERAALRGDYGSPEFAESYRLALMGTATPSEIGASRTTVGSLNHLIVSYKLSSHWTGLAKNSQRTRRPIMEKLRTGPWGAVMVRDLQQRHVRAVLDGVTGGHAKRHWMKSLRALLSFAVEIGQIETDPSVGIKVKVKATGGYHTWSGEEISQYRAFWALGTEARLTLELALESASRRVEITRIGRQHVRDGRIRIARVKGCHAVDVLLSPELAGAIAAMPSSNHLTFLVAGDGQPFSPDQLGLQFARWATAAGLPQRCRLHGLRKSRAAQLAASGASAHEIMAITGHRSLPEVQRYTAQYDRSRAADAAMARLLKTGTGL
jgi:integrase